MDECGGGDGGDNNGCHDNDGDDDTDGDGGETEHESGQETWEEERAPLRPVAATWLGQDLRQFGRDGS